MNEKDYLKELKNSFYDQNELDKAIDLHSYEKLSLTEITKIPELNRFFGAEEDSWFDFLQKGLSSLRQGFYLICDEPFYKTSIFPHTFAAKVYYYHPSNDVLIKYQANIGPMTNSHSGYLALPETISHENIPIVQDYIFARKNQIEQDEYYFKPKKRFFDSIYNSKKIFCVRSAEFDPSYPNLNPRPKKIIWSFIDY